MSTPIKKKNNEEKNVILSRIVTGYENWVNHYEMESNKTLSTLSLYSVSVLAADGVVLSDPVMLIIESVYTLSSITRM